MSIMKHVLVNWINLHILLTRIHRHVGMRARSTLGIAECQTMERLAKPRMSLECHGRDLNPTPPTLNAHVLITKPIRRSYVQRLLEVTKACDG